MFTVFEPGGLRAPYVPGSFRRRNVEKILKASATGKVRQEDSPPVFQKTAGPSSFQARLYEQVESFTQSARTNILAREIMSSPVVTLSITASLSQAWEVVHSKRFRHIPILGEDDSVVGILSDRDLFRGRMESVLSGTTWSTKQIESPIRDLVSHPVLVAAPDAEMRAIARFLLEERIGELPLVSDAGGLVGMVTRSDICVSWSPIPTLSSGCRKGPASIGILPGIEHLFIGVIPDILNCMNLKPIVFEFSRETFQCPLAL